MAKMRVHQIAKELGLASKDALDMLTKLGVDVRNHASTIEDADAAKLRGLVKNGSTAPPPPAGPPATGGGAAPGGDETSPRRPLRAARGRRARGASRIERDHRSARRLGHRLRRQDRQVPDRRHQAA